jgi:hypothetical protein
MDNQTTKEPVKFLVMSCSGASNTGDYADKIAASSMNKMTPVWCAFQRFQ